MLYHRRALENSDFVYRQKIPKTVALNYQIRKSSNNFVKNLTKKILIGTKIGVVEE